MKNLSWLFSFPFEAFFETRCRIEESEEYLSVLNHTLKVLDPAIKGIIKLNELENTYAILMGKEEILIKNDKIFANIWGYAIIHGFMAPKLPTKLTKMCEVKE